MRILICDDEGIVQQAIRFRSRKALEMNLKLNLQKMGVWRSNLQSHFARILS